MEATLTAEEGPLAGHTFGVRPGATCFIGQQAGSGVRLSGPGVEARHAAVRLGPAGLEVVDLGSTLGTLLDGRRLPPRAPTPAPPGALLTVGAHALRVELLGDDGAPLAAAPAATDLGLPPDLTFVRELGRGGMGRVVAARRPDGALVAVKLLADPVAEGSTDHERFLREGAVGQRLVSPFIVRVLDLRVAARRALIIMELVEGPSLRDVVARGPLPLPAALTIGQHLSGALTVAAAAGVVHRDLKPANVLLSPDGVARLCDFGVAKDLGGAVRSLTRSGQGLGTLAYMAPEMISEAKHVDARADVYGLGATLYHLLTGRPLFEVKTLRELVATLDLAPPPVEALRPEVPPALSALVAATLARAPAGRPTAREVNERLRAMGPAADLRPLLRA